MSKFPKLAFILGTALVLTGSSAYADGDASAGKSVFNKCRACHAVGEGAANKIGPQLNALMGRTAGGETDYTYSNAMKDAGEGGLVWDEESLVEFLHDPKETVKGTKMSFAGLRKDADIANVLAYLATFSPDNEADLEDDAEAGDAVETADGSMGSKESIEAKSDSGAAKGADASGDEAATGRVSDGPLKLGRVATEEEVAAWDFDVRPDGKGLPDGHGTVAEGEAIFTDQCAMCHGDFGEGRDRWPVLAGGQDTLTRDRPVKTVGSYWPYLSTVYDYVHRAMPFGNARSLSDDDVYALTAYILYLNDIVTEDDFELSKKNFETIEMPNASAFIPDDRAEEEHYKADAEPCMTDCKPAPVEITMQAQVLDVTPDADSGSDKPAAGNVD